MKEQDLIDLGFDKMEDFDEESTFYYYELDIGIGWSASILSSGNYEVKNDEWDVQLTDTCIIIKDKEKLIELITVLKKNMVTKQP